MFQNFESTVHYSLAPPPPPSPRWHQNFDEVVGLMSSDDPDSYADGSIATGTVCHAQQINRYPVNVENMVSS